MLDYKFSLISLFSILNSCMYLFMFANSDSYFNINNYRTLLFGTVIVGGIALLILITNGKIKWDILTVATVSLLLYMFFIKFVLKMRSEPFYLMYISVLYSYVLIIGKLPFKKRDLRMLVVSYVVSSTVLAFLLLAMGRQPYASYNIFRKALYFNEVAYYDVNFMSMYMYIPTILCIYISFKVKGFSKYLYTVAFLINFTAILFLGSRGTVIPIIIIVLYILMRNKKISVSNIMIAICVVFFVKYLLPQDVVERLFTGRDLSGDSKRLIDWAYGIEVIKRSPWLGNGLLPPAVLVNELGYGGFVKYTIHNTYLVYLAQFGFLGAAPFFAIVFTPLIRLWRKGSLLWWFTYGGLIFSAMMIEANYTYALIVPMSLIYALIRYQQENSLEDPIEYIFKVGENNA